MKFCKSLFLLVICLLISITAASAEEISLTSQAHVENEGWLNPVEEDGLTGTVGLNESLEAFKLNISSGSIIYSSHVATIGWQDDKTNGDVSGTTGEGLPIEAIKISLSPELRSEYDVVYRVHCANLGWLDWAKNGEIAGTTGLAIDIQAIQVKLEPVGTPETNETGHSYLSSEEISRIDRIQYQAHCAYIGWQNNVENGATAGTLGEARQIEGLKIDAPDISNFSEDSHIQYQAHVSYYGWLDPVSDGNLAGTEGQGLGLQAIKVSLTGQVSLVSDVYYRTYVQNVGWLGWSKNGEESGTTGFGLPIEALEIVVLPKNSDSPGDRSNNYFTADSNYFVSAQSYVENLGWTDIVNASNIVGTIGQGLGIEGLYLTVPNLNNNSGINYELMVEDVGWQGTHSNGDAAGIIGANKQAEAIKINLTGTIASFYDVYYQAQCQDQGWLGWTCNDGVAGTSKGNKKLESIRVMLVPKCNEEKPHSDIEPYREVENKLTPANIPNFNLICAIVQHEGGASYEGALAVMSCVMNRCDSGRWGGTDPVSVLTAPGQFSSYLDGYYLQYINNPSPVVQQAVLDCMNGLRSHPYQSFRSYATGGSVCIGGNWFF